MTPMLNFVPAGRMARRQEFRRKRSWGLSLAIYAGLLGVAWLAMAGRSTGANRVVAADLAKADDQIKRLTVDAQTRRKAIAKLQESQTLLARIAERPDWSLLLGLIAQTVGDDATLTSLELTPTTPAGTASPLEIQQYIVRLMGNTRSQTNVSKLVQRLKANPLLGDVKIVRSNREGPATKAAIFFEVSCTVRDGGGVSP